MYDRDLSGAKLWFGYLALLFLSVVAFIIPVMVPVVGLSYIGGGYFLRIRTKQMHNLYTLATSAMIVGLAIFVSFAIFMFLFAPAYSTTSMTTVAN